MRETAETTETLIGKIRAAWIQARKEREKDVAGILGTLMGSIEKVGKDNGNRESTDAEAEVVIAKFLKDLKETFKIFSGEVIDDFKPQSDNTSEKHTSMAAMFKEAQIYKSYLPQQLSISELVDIINECTGIGMTNKGQFMGHMNKNFKGQYDGRMVSGLIEEILESQKEI